MKKLYSVTWITKRNRQEREHEQVFEAANAKAARAAFDQWYADKRPGLFGPPPHPFHITVRAIR